MQPETIEQLQQGIKAIEVEIKREQLRTLNGYGNGERRTQLIAFKQQILEKITDLAEEAKLT